METQGKIRENARGFSWLIAFLLLSCLALNYIDRQSLAVLFRFLPPELKMSNITYAHITSVFLLANAITVPISGWLMDRLGARIGLAIAVSTWSLFEMLCGTATTRHPPGPGLASPPAN